MTALDSDEICSLIVWENETAIDYSEEDLDRHGLTTVYKTICDNRADDCQVSLYDIDDEEIDTVTVRDLREFICRE